MQTQGMDLWMQEGKKERVGQVEKVTLAQIDYHV